MKITLSAENIVGIYFKQEGSGRQGLYLDLSNLDGAPDQRVYWGETSPNPREQWDLRTHDEVNPKQRAVAFDEDGEPTAWEDVPGEFVDLNGEEWPADRIFPTIFDGIVAMVAGVEVEVSEVDPLDLIAAAERGEDDED